MFEFGQVDLRIIILLSFQICWLHFFELWIYQIKFVQFQDFYLLKPILNHKFKFIIYFYHLKVIYNLVSFVLIAAYIDFFQFLFYRSDFSN
jgi:hypothetical protein